VRLVAQMHGGGHEKGHRSGTLPTHQIVGMGEAARLARLEMPQEISRIQALRDRLWAGIAPLGHVWVNGDPQQRVAHNQTGSGRALRRSAMSGSTATRSSGWRIT